MAAPQRFVLAHHRSPGDIVCMTTLVRDIKLRYGRDVQIDVQTTAPDLWRHNPHITKLWDVKKNISLYPGVKFLKMAYNEGIRKQNHETVHFAAYFHRDFKKKTKLDVPVYYPHGDLHLSPEEKESSLIEGRYWVMVAGGKNDAPVKVWRQAYFQQVADWLASQGIGVVQIGSTDKNHWHPRLTNVMDLIGKTNLRDMMRLIHHADGVVCGVTAAMHMAAALHRPCVCIGGGREAWWWEAYVNENKGFGPHASGKHPMPHRYLHTIGLLDCCKYHGCWKNKVVKINDDNLLCRMPVIGLERPLPKCMEMIRPEHVIEAIMSYYTDGSLPPVKLGSIEKPKSLPKTEDAPESPQKPCGQSTPIRTGAKATLKLPPNMAGLPIKINPRAKMETRGPEKAAAAAVLPENPGNNAQDIANVFDHPAVGGKFTVCVLFYGPEKFHDLHKRCLETLTHTMPQGRMDLRVASNAANDRTLQMIEAYVDSGVISKHYYNPDNRFKYPVMRDMFFDPEYPIRTKWVLWFDDDSICDGDPNWATVLSRHIIQHHPNSNYHMIGARYHLKPNADQWRIFESRPWYNGRPRRLQNGAPSTNGDRVVFATGGFWAITHKAIIDCDIPDLGTGLTHTGGDWQIGEQLYQGGYDIKQFNGKKQFVRTSSVPRRGVTAPLIDEVAKGHTLPVPPPQPVSTPKLATPPAVPQTKVTRPPVSQQPTRFTVIKL